MQVTIGILAISIVQLLTFVAVVYLSVYLHMIYKINIGIHGLSLMALLSLNLMLLTQRLMGRSGFILPHTGSDLLLYFVQCCVLLLVITRFIWIYRKMPNHRRNMLTPQSIRETIDSLPGGICFFIPNGMPVLTNRMMNELVYQLTGHTIINAQSAWEQLLEADLASGCLRLDDPWTRSDQLDAPDADALYFQLPDESIWRIQRKDLGEQEPHFVQLEASDITELHRYSNQLQEHNRILADQHLRMQNLLENIMEINQEKELLSTKMMIHDEFGRSILKTKQHLSDHTLLSNISQLAEVWDTTIKNMENFTQVKRDFGDSAEIELLKAADLIGCKIDFIGDRPEGRKATLLFYATVREALTNAVMHSGADLLVVSTVQREDGGYHVDIRDNGNILVDSITEGNGLGNLRRRLEQEGASLLIKCEDGVVLILDLPGERS